MSWLVLILLVGGFLAGFRKERDWVDIFGYELFFIGVVAFALLALFGNSLTALRWSFSILVVYVIGSFLIWAVGFAIGKLVRSANTDDQLPPGDV